MSAIEVEIFQSINDAQLAFPLATHKADIRIGKMSGAPRFSGVAFLDHRSDVKIP